MKKLAIFLLLGLVLSGTTSCAQSTAKLAAVPRDFSTSGNFQQLNPQILRESGTLAPSGVFSIFVDGEAVTFRPEDDESTINGVKTTMNTREADGSRVGKNLQSFANAKNQVLPHVSNFPKSIILMVKKLTIEGKPKMLLEITQGGVKDPFWVSSIIYDGHNHSVRVGSGWLSAKSTGLSQTGGVVNVKTLETLVAQ